MKKPTHRFKPTANPILANAMRELRRSNAAGIHRDKRQKRARTREAARRKAMKDSE